MSGYLGNRKLIPLDICSMLVDEILYHCILISLYHVHYEVVALFYVSLVLSLLFS